GAGGRLHRLRLALQHGAGGAFGGTAQHGREVGPVGIAGLEAGGSAALAQHAVVGLDGPGDVRAHGSLRRTRSSERSKAAVMAGGGAVLAPHEKIAPISAGYRSSAAAWRATTR